MPEYNVLGASKILKTHPGGVLDLDKSREALNALIHHENWDEADGILFDLRDATCDLGDGDLFELVSHIAGMEAHQDHKVAVVIPESSEVDRAKFARSVHSTGELTCARSKI